jgi:hypothetical protein
MRYLRFILLDALLAVLGVRTSLEDCINKVVQRVLVIKNQITLYCHLAQAGRRGFCCTISFGCTWLSEAQTVAQDRGFEYEHPPIINLSS